MAMYLDFYGLERDPFGPTPDPRLPLPDAGHKEALAQLVYASRRARASSW